MMHTVDVDGSPRLRRRSDLTAVVVGTVVLAAGMVVVRDGTVPAWERSLFEAVNGAPDWVYGPLWPFQELGMLLVGPAVAAVAVAARRRRLAAAALAATVAKLVLERVVKLMVDRQRPARSIGAAVELRGDVNVSGRSFVSGHAVLATALAALIAPYLPARWRVVPALLVGVVMVARVYVGAHNPLDVVCGAALGLMIGCGLNLAFGVPASSGSAAG